MHDGVDPDLERTIANLVRDGGYASRTDVLREGIGLVEQRDARLRALDDALARAGADADAGRVKPGSEIGARLRAKYEAQIEDHDA